MPVWPAIDPSLMHAADSADVLEKLASSRDGLASADAAARLAGCGLLLAYLPPVARLFGFVPMAPVTLSAMLAITAAYVFANEWAKRAFGARVHF